LKVPSLKPVANAVSTAEPLFAVVVTVKLASCCPVRMQTLVAGFCVGVEITAIEGTLKES
jgi:hypothetical protein